MGNSTVSPSGSPDAMNDGKSAERIYDLDAPDGPVGRCHYVAAGDQVYLIDAEGEIFYVPGGVAQARRDAARRLVAALVGIDVAAHQAVSALHFGDSDD